jgi:hypothetical protein
MVPDDVTMWWRVRRFFGVIWQWITFFKYRPWLKCENVCGWVWPYGYVPECGCPVHDPDERR